MRSTFACEVDMKQASRFYRKILVVGIGVVSFMLLWSMFTPVTEASPPLWLRRGLAPGSAVPMSQVPPSASPAEATAWAGWVKTPTALPWPYDVEYPLRHSRRTGTKRRKHGRPSRQVNRGHQPERSSDPHSVEADKAIMLQSSIQRMEPSLSEDVVVSTITIGVSVLPLNMCLSKPTVTSVTASTWLTTGSESLVVPASVSVRTVTGGVNWDNTSTAPFAATGLIPQGATAQTWVMHEMAALDLRDQRLNRRACRLVEQFAARSTASIPGACGNWANSKAAYRFFDNAKVTHAAIVAGHRPACLERIRHEDLVLVVQDTTSLDYTHHPNTQGLGVIDSTFAQGVMVHTSLAVSDAGVPLGLLAQQVWARDPEEKGQWKKRKQRPIEDKESFKWVAAQRASLKDLPAQVCVITVADREADVYELFQEAQETPTQFVIRASWNRRLKQPAGDLWGTVAGTPVRGEFIVEVGRAPDRLPRQAKVQVRFLPVTLKPPSRPACQKIKLKPVHLYAIEVRELNPPAEAEPLHWLLLTNRLIETFEQARQCVRWYCLRWLVERYHFVLKSGCQIEARQLETAKRLERCLGIYAIVAWRLLWLTYQSRRAPHLPCTVALQTHEWQALYCYIHKTPMPPDAPPSLYQATRWIAQLGGFLGRKHDGEPGAKVLWRGWQRLNDMAETWQLAHPTTEKDVGNG